MIDLHDCTYISPTSISVESMHTVFTITENYFHWNTARICRYIIWSENTIFDCVFESICTESNHRLFTFLYSLIEINWPQNIFYYNWLMVEFSCSFWLHNYEVHLDKNRFTKQYNSSSEIIDSIWILIKYVSGPSALEANFDLRINIFLNVNQLNCFYHHDYDIVFWSKYTSIKLGINKKS